MEREQPMSSETDTIAKLTALNRITETLNRAVDVRGVLGDTLADLVELMGLETGWIFLKDAAAQDRWWGPGYSLAAYHNLPPAMALDRAEAWAKGCDCQKRCNQGCAAEAYNVARCSRLAALGDEYGDRRGLGVHASAPIRSGETVLGLLNVAGQDWSSFSPQALVLLTNVGQQIGVALERAQLFDLMQERRIHEQAFLLEFSNRLLGSLDLHGPLDYLVEEARKLARADACAVLLPGDRPDRFEFWAASGWRAAPSSHGPVSAEEQNGLGIAVRWQQPVVVQDLDAEPSSQQRPGWLVAEGIRGHALVPLVADGRSVGALVIGRREPWQPGEQEMRLLQLMANQAAMAIERARLHREEVNRRTLEKELALGQQIQRGLLPAGPPAVPGWEFAASYDPARLVGGDFYGFDAVPGEPPRLGILIGDVAGKGVPAALLMALSRAILRAVAREGLGPAKALTRANEQILEVSQSNLFLTAFYAMLEAESGKLVFANAGHNPPLWLQAATGEMRPLAAAGIALGAVDQIELEEREIQLAPGDLLLLYTDGITEAMDANSQLFGEARLSATLAAHAGDHAQQVLAAVVDAARAHTGSLPQSDDMTVVAIRRCFEPRGGRVATLSLFADLRQLGAIRDWVVARGRELGLPQEAVYDLQLAVDEACTNVVVHAYRGQGGPIEVQIGPADGGVQVTIHDHGAPFDPESVPIPDVTAPLEERRLGGMGLFLMRKLMDRVEFTFDAVAGNRLTMVKRSSRSDNEPPNLCVSL